MAAISGNVRRNKVADLAVHRVVVLPAEQGVPHARRVGPIGLQSAGQVAWVSQGRALRTATANAVNSLLLTTVVRQPSGGAIQRRVEPADGVQN